MLEKGTKLRTYIMNVLLGIDQLGNALIGGDPDETISSTLGKWKRANDGKLQWWPRPFTSLIAWTLNKWDTHHVEKSIEEDEGDRDLR